MISKGDCESENERKCFEGEISPAVGSSQVEFDESFASGHAEKRTHASRDVVNDYTRGLRGETGAIYQY